jgi:hypothetical protein
LCSAALLWRSGYVAHMRRSLGVAGCWTVAIALVLLAPAATSSSSVVMFSDPGD